MLAKRFEEQRCLIVISDGWGHMGYENVWTIKEAVDDMIKRGVIVIGRCGKPKGWTAFFIYILQNTNQKIWLKNSGQSTQNSPAKTLETQPKTEIWNSTRSFDMWKSIIIYLKRKHEF
jgi:hypothetical protein